MEKMTKGDEDVAKGLCPMCGKVSDYPGGTCKNCYKRLKEEGYWADRFERVKEWLS